MAWRRRSAGGAGENLATFAEKPVAASIQRHHGGSGGIGGNKRNNQPGGSVNIGVSKMKRRRNRSAAESEMQRRGGQRRKAINSVMSAAAAISISVSLISTWQSAQYHLAKWHLAIIAGNGNGVVAGVWRRGQPSA
jgi:hypothetical protein